MIEIWGLATCDSCRKAMAQLKVSGQEARLRDLRKAPLSQDERAQLIATLGPRVINRASATWRGLEESARALPIDDLLARYPAVMKRPVMLGHEGQLMFFASGTPAIKV